MPDRPDLKPAFLKMLDQRQALDGAPPWGSRTAVQRLLRIHGNKTRPDHDQARIVALHVDLVARSDTRQIAGVLDEISRKEPKLRAA